MEKKLYDEKDGILLCDFYKKIREGYNVSECESSGSIKEDNNE